MRFRKIALILLIGCLLLGGCSRVDALENQGYALVFGADMTPSGEIELSVRLPKISGSGGGNSGGDRDSTPYLTASARGSDYAQALERLEWAVPRALNLSHIKLLVVSRALAADDAFPRVLSQIAETHHLYTAARFVVCAGDAKTFIADQKVVMGTRLSNEISAIFDHYVALGYVPDAVFGDAYYALHSIYSDPVAIWGTLSEAADDAPAPPSLEEAQAAGSRVDTPSKESYLGAAVFREGRLAGRLDARETLLLNLVNGKLESLRFVCGDRTYALIPARRVGKRVDVWKGRAHIAIDVRLSAADLIPEADRLAIESTLAARLRAVVERCQRLGVEPFGLARKAARHFPTVPEWRAFGWRERFREADLEVSVRVTGQAD